MMAVLLSGKCIDLLSSRADHFRNWTQQARPTGASAAGKFVPFFARVNGVIVTISVQEQPKEQVRSSLAVEAVSFCRYGPCMKRSRYDAPANRGARSKHAQLPYGSFPPSSPLSPSLSTSPSLLSLSLILFLFSLESRLYSYAPLFNRLETGNSSSGNQSGTKVEVSFCTRIAQNNQPGEHSLRH